MVGQNLAELLMARNRRTTTIMSTEQENDVLWLV